MRIDLWSVQSCKQQPQKKGRTVELVEKRCLSHNRKLYLKPLGKTRIGWTNTVARVSGVADTRPVSMKESGRNVKNTAVMKVNNISW